jgi:hypothetical protein
MTSDQSKPKWYEEAIFVDLLMYFISPLGMVVVFKSRRIPLKDKVVFGIGWSIGIVAFIISILLEY